MGIYIFISIVSFLFCRWFRCAIHSPIHHSAFHISRTSRFAYNMSYENYTHFYIINGKLLSCCCCCFFCWCYTVATAEVAVAATLAFCVCAREWMSAFFYVLKRFIFLCCFASFAFYCWQRIMLAGCFRCFLCFQQSQSEKVTNSMNCKTTITFWINN